MKGMAAGVVTALLINVAFQAWDWRFLRRGGWWEWLDRMGFQQQIHDRAAVSDLLAQLAPSPIAGRDDFLQADRLSGQLLTDRVANEHLAVVDANLGHIARVIADRHILADIGRQVQIDVAQPLKANAILLDAAGAGDSQQQQVQLRERLGQARQKAFSLPARLWRHRRLTMNALLIALQQEGAQARLERIKGQLGRRWGRTRW